MRTALTIAGSDSSGGAGIQADIKTMTANGVFAMSAVTALTAQNTTGVKDIMEVSPAFLKEQLDCVFTDIRPDAVKIGMVSSSELIRAIADKLKEYRAENIVVDPVMVATSGARLISEDAVETLKECLLPEADILTPNIPEAGMPMTCYVRAVSVAGFTESGSTTRTPMEPGAHCQALLPPIWQRAFPWRNRWNGQKLTYPERWEPCWIWERAADR